MVSGAERHIERKRDLGGLDNRKTRGRELRPTTRQQYRMLLDTYIYPAFGDQRLDLISADDVNKWYDALVPGRETIRAQAYSLLRTIFTSAASERPQPLIPYNPAHIRGAGNTKRLHKVRPASLAELETIVEELPDRYQLMALLAAWCAWTACSSSGRRSRTPAYATSPSRRTEATVRLLPRR